MALQLVGQPFDEVVLLQSRDRRKRKQMRIFDRLAKSNWRSGLEKKSSGVHTHHHHPPPPKKKESTRKENLKESLSGHCINSS